MPALGSYQSYAAASTSSSYTQPAGRGPYSMAGTDNGSNYTSYSQAGGYGTGYNKNTTAGASTYDDQYDTSDSYYGQTEAGYDASDYGGYSSYPGDYDNNSYTGYGTGTSTTAGSYMPGTGSLFGKPAMYSSNVASSSVRASISAAGSSLQQPSLVADEYYTSSGKADLYGGHGGTGDTWSENWSNQQQEEEDYYGYGETGVETEYDSYGQSTSGYGDYDSSYPDYPDDQNYDASSSSYYEPASNTGGGGGSWSAGPSGYGTGVRGSYSGTLTGVSQTTSTPSRSGSFGYQGHYGTPSSQSQAGSTGFQVGRGGGLPSSTYGTAISQAAPRGGGGDSGGGGTSYTSPSSVATGFTLGGGIATCTTSQTFGTGGFTRGGGIATCTAAQTFGGTGYTRGGSTATCTTASQRAPRVDGFTSYMAGTSSSLLGDPESSDMMASQYSQFSESRPSRRSNQIPGILDSEYSTTSSLWSEQQKKPGTADPQHSTSSGRWSDQKPGMTFPQHSTTSSQWSEEKLGTAVLQHSTTSSRWSDQKPGTGTSDSQYSTQFGESSRSKQADYTQMKADTTQTTRSSDHSGPRVTTRSSDYSVAPLMTQSSHYSGSSRVTTTQSSDHTGPRVTAHSSDYSAPPVTTQSSHYSGSLCATTQSSDHSGPQVFDYGHQECDEDVAARSSDRSYYLANISTARPPAKRKASPSPDRRRAGSGSSTGQDWRKSSDDVTSRRQDAREQGQNVSARRSRDDREESRDRSRASTSYSEKSSTSSSSSRQSSSLGHGRSAQDRWYATEAGGGSSSRSSSTGGRSFDPVKTSAVVKIPGLMDDIVTTMSSAKSAQVCESSLLLCC